MTKREAFERAVARFPFEEVRAHLATKKSYWPKGAPPAAEIRADLESAFRRALGVTPSFQPAWVGILYVGIFSDRVTVGCKGIGSRVPDPTGERQWRLAPGPRWMVENYLEEKPTTRETGEETR